MSKSILNTMVLKALFEDVNGIEILQSLIESGLVTDDHIKTYYRLKNKEQLFEIANKIRYSVIENGQLVKFDERDLDENGNYTVPNKVKRIARYAFGGCENINKITIDNRVKFISPKAFYKCKLRSIDLGNVETIGEEAFNFCINLEEVFLSSKLKYVGKSVFSNCINLTRINTPLGNTIDLSGGIIADREDAQHIVEDYVEQNKEMAK